MKITPFRHGNTTSALRAHEDAVLREINSLDNEYVLKAAPTELEAYFVDKIGIAPLVLRDSDYYIDERASVKVDVSHDFRRGIFPGERAVVQGTQIDVAVPFEGDGELWKLQPSHFSLSAYPEIDVRDGTIVFSCVFPDDSADAETLRSEIQSKVGLIANAVANIRKDVEAHNAAAPGKVQAALNAKRKKATASIGAIEQLGIPVKRRDEPASYAMPLQRRRAIPPRPAVTTEKLRLEPILDAAEYDHILDILRSMSLVIERNPASFASLNEETIRTHFLLQLNGHYDGGATGESFNAAGKTDILLRVENRNAFIAECKFWRGEKAFGEAIDQLLCYLSWRDSKCALLIFNRGGNSTAVRSKMREVMEARPEHRKTCFHSEGGDSRYIFVKSSDPGREITITTMLFDLPRAPAKSRK